MSADCLYVGRREATQKSLSEAFPRAYPERRADDMKAKRAMTTQADNIATPDAAAPGKELTPAARRALEEAAGRRAGIDARAADLAKTKEHQGRGGLEPVRYEDWEVKGLASDF
jgi:hypothetical protein